MKRMLAVAIALAMATSVLGIAPMRAAPANALASPTCQGRVTSALAENGYAPGRLARLTPNANAATVIRSIKAGCAATGSVPQVTAQVLVNAQLQSVEIGSFLEGVFGLSALQAVATLKAVGFDSVEVAEALIEVYESNAPTTVALLEQEGFAAPAVAVALRDAHEESAESTGFWLLTAFSFSAIPEALEEAYNVSEEWAIGAWESTKEWAVDFGTTFADKVLAEKDRFCDAGVEAGYPACTTEFWAHTFWEIQWEKTKDYYGYCWNPQTDPDLANWGQLLDPTCWVAYGSGEFYRHIGLPAYELGVKAYEWIQDPTFHAPRWLTQMLRSVGYGATETADALKNAYDTSADWVVGAYHTVGYGATETAEALKDAYGATEDWLVGAYHTVGYGATETAEALKDAYGATEDWLVGAYHTVGYGATETAEALKDAYGVTADWLAGAMKDAYEVTQDWMIQELHVLGYAATDIADAMRDAYNVSAQWIVDRFEDLGYASSVVKDAIIDAYDWTEEQVNEILDEAGDWFCGWWPWGC